MGKAINRDEVSLGNDVDIPEGGMMSSSLCGSTNSHWVILSWDGNISKNLPVIYGVEVLKGWTYGVRHGPSSALLISVAIGMEQNRSH